MAAKTADKPPLVCCRECKHRRPDDKPSISVTIPDGRPFMCLCSLGHTEKGSTAKKLFINKPRYCQDYA